MHQPLRGFLVEIGDVFHNIISRKTLNRPKEMNAVSTKVLLPFFPPVCTFAPSLFSQVGLTILWNTKLPNLQLHIVKPPFLHLHFYIANLTRFGLFYGLPKCSACPQKNPLIAQFFLKVIFAKSLSFWAVFFWGGGGAWISGLPSYLLGYILTNLHTHPLRLPMHLPTYLPRCRPLSSPTYILGNQLMTKFPSMQVYKFANLQNQKL